MASELRVDKIHNEGGDNDSGIDLSTNDQIVLKTANTTRLTMDATGQTTIVGEGGSTTTNLQQGLCKAWVMADSDASLEDSFNISSPTDVSTGTYTFSLTNAMAAVNRYSQSGCGRGGTDNRVMTRNTAGDTASVIGVEMSIGDTSALTDHPVDVQIVGDLA